MSENVFNHDQALKQDKAGSKGYDINQHANEIIGPVNITPRDLAEMDYKMNSGWWAQQRQDAKLTGSEENWQSRNPSIFHDHKTYPDYPNVIGKIKRENNFTFKGREYFRHGGATYLAQNSIPNIGKMLSPEEATALDDERAKLLMDLPAEPMDGPFGPISAGVATAGVSIAGGSTVAAGVLKGARKLLGRSLWDFTK